MGPSGAGKTTFLNALSGKAYYGVCHCTAYILLVNYIILASVGRLLWFLFY